jgi:hypothetical protein
MALTLLTTEDAQSILQEMQTVRMLIGEVGQDVGKLMQMRSDLEDICRQVAGLKPTLRNEVQYYRSQKYRDSIITEYRECKKRNKKKITKK